MLYYLKKGKNESEMQKQTNKQKVSAVYGEDTVAD